MRLITWNCNMAFRRKADLILSYKPDILVVPECECPEKLLFAADTPKPTDVLWFGRNNNKGLAIFSYSDYRFRVLNSHNADLRMVIPIYVSNGKSDFNMFAIWANNPEDKGGQYVEQVWKAILHYDSLISSTKTILIGDFNSNTIWDRKSRISNHSDLVRVLQQKGVHSTYHLHHKQTQGTEAHPTLYLYRHRNRPYHLDYCFVSEDMAEKLESVEVGNYDFWTKYSDHVPVIVTFRD
jgi:exodeoxyribonuclease-3